MGEIVNLVKIEKRWTRIPKTYSPGSHMLSFKDSKPCSGSDKAGQVMGYEITAITEQIMLLVRCSDCGHELSTLYQHPE